MALCTDRRQLLGLAASAGVAALTPSGVEAKGTGPYPPGFLWGAAVAGHQVEGGNVNSDMWLLEQIRPGPFAEPSGDACDEYHLYEQDIALLKKLGFNAFRFSLEWSRIEPEKGQFSAAELGHYVDVATACRRHGVTPVVTFNHFTVPRWFAAQGGWENPESPELFERFCAYAARRMGPLIGVAGTFNEPNLGWLLRTMLPPEIIAGMGQAMKEAARRSGSDRFSTVQFVDPALITDNMIAAHKRAYAVLKAGPGDYPVGASVSMIDEQSAGPGSIEAALKDRLYGDWLRALGETGDFVGVQTYSSRLVGPDGPLRPAPGVELTQSGEAFTPEAIGGTIRYAHQVSKKPIYVTENGVATEDDARRVVYIDRALKAVEACLRDGIPVRSYIHWSLLDNFEWVMGYRPKLGLVAVDRATQIRTPKPSAYHLGAIAKKARGLKTA